MSCERRSNTELDLACAMLSLWCESRPRFYLQEPQQAEVFPLVSLVTCSSNAYQHHSVSQIPADRSKAEHV